MATSGRISGRMRFAVHPWLLALYLFLAVFLNGFEAGGYQACLQSIGSEYALNGSLMGAFASVQLIACLIAPLVFGPIADRHGKKSMVLVFLALKIVGCLLIVAFADIRAFLVGIFLVGLAVSTSQYISIAALADAYPISGRRKIGYMTGMYSLGAVLAPLLCGAFLGAGAAWRFFFGVLIVLTAIVIAGLAACGFEPKEQLARATTLDSGEPGASRAGARGGRWVLSGIVVLCLIMFVYVGVENGIAYFLNTFVGVELGGADSYLALSLFWLAMIPSRLFCGVQDRHRAALLLIATIGVSVLTAAMGFMVDPVAAAVLAFALGLFSGAVYPCVLSYNADFEGDRSATATGLITAATGLGGALVTLAFGWMTDALGIRVAFMVLGAFMLLAVFCVLLLFRLVRNLK